MIALAHTLAVVWLCGIPVAFLVFGWIIRRAPPLVRFHFRREPYALWCVGWPAAVFVITWRSITQWWMR